ncbi:MAG: S8 family serine peptidase, partial [Lentisphaerae bacterium]|nr:S8 family serine peptidase [Lentisphaerota bacterium]
VFAAAGLLTATAPGPGFAQKSETDGRWVPGEAVVTFRAAGDADAARPRLRRRRISLVRRFAWLAERRGRDYALLRSPELTTPALLALLRQDPRVADAAPNYLRRRSTSRAAPASDPLYGAQWALHNTGQSVQGWTGAADADIDYPEAWHGDSGSTATVIIAVVDTGVDHTHPDLYPSMWRNPGEVPGNGIDDDGNGFVDDILGYDFSGNGGGAPPDNDPMDGDTEYSHGTHVAGIAAAARNNDEGIAGVCHRARLMALKGSPDGVNLPVADTIAAIEYAVLMKQRGHNVAVINASFGLLDSYVQAERDAIETAGAAGIVFCAAAGNARTDTDTRPHYPAGYNLANILCVTATSQSDGLAWFSNYGAASVDIGAPGVNILSTLAGGNYGYMQGSSMAAPHAAGAVAFLARNFPDDGFADRIGRILSTVDPLPELAGKTATGGRLNLQRAVDSDADGLPDWWELGLTNSLARMNDSSDTDADRFPDLHEYLAGTDALDSTSYLRLSGASGVPGGGVILRWPSTAGKSYRLRRSGSLLATPAALASNLAATPPQNVYTDTTAVTEGVLFYRLDLE